MFAYSQKTKSHSCLWNFYALSLTKQKQQATQKREKEATVKVLDQTKATSNSKWEKEAAFKEGQKKVVSITVAHYNLFLYLLIRH